MPLFILPLIFFLFALVSIEAIAHGVDETTRHFLLQSQGVQFMPFVYIGAKHMITGYDHLLFIAGVIFFLYKSREIILYVSMFTIGHSITLLYGVLNDIQINAYLIDAIIGLSIVYKGFDNLGGFKRTIGFSPNPKAAVLIFGLFHGFGLATKIQEFGLSSNGLLTNLIAFNVGVEIGQLSALALILIFISFWRKHHSFKQFSATTNTLLMSAGFMLMGYHLTGYAVS
ncbi:HupE/UreJ family protein [Flocculibacter collagenilyticus]|uniref:HupE/UreJ family protein n=1 Tax=Flocculibacter collagenilyticus TaxID=2744479 RepID=UPI003898FC30